MVRWWVGTLVVGFLGLSLPMHGEQQESKARSQRTYLGLLPVEPGQRDVVIAYLKEKGCDKFYVPESGSPETLFFRGTRAEYEEALKQLWALESQPAVKKTMMKQPAVKKTAVQQRDGKDDSEVYDKLELSPLQKELCEQLTKDMVKKSAEFKGKPPTPENIEKGKKVNQWKKQTLRSILTRDQYAEYYRQYGAEAPAGELGAEPKVKEARVGEQKTDEAIFARLKLSQKQEEHLKKLVEWMKEATKEMKRSDDPIAEGSKLNKKWREGLDRIFTKAQRQQYLDYWGPPPAGIVGQ
jgi:hypothetical protein